MCSSRNLLLIVAAVPYGFAEEAKGLRDGLKMIICKDGGIRLRILIFKGRPRAETILFPLLDCTNEFQVGYSYPNYFSEFLDF